MTLAVGATGPLALIQDLGRPGHARSGVPASGAYDRAALRMANTLVGNASGAPALECLLGGLMLTTTERCTVAVTGADVPIEVSANETAPPPATETGRESPDPARRSMPLRQPFELRPGMRLRLGRAREGLRTYVGVRGGIAGTAVLGSTATDTLSGLGPRRLMPGDRLEIGSQWVEFPGPEPLKLRPLSAVAHVVAGAREIRVQLGPFDDIPREIVAELLNDGDWRVSPNSDRVGLRLHATALSAADWPGTQPRATPPRGPTPMFRGVIQMPPSGELIIMGPDAPTTGGYPIIGVVDDADLDCLAQLRPGRSVRFSVD